MALFAVRFGYGFGEKWRLQHGGSGAGDKDKGVVELRALRGKDVKSQCEIYSRTHKMHPFR